jgi:hypothetical protein
MLMNQELMTDEKIGQAGDAGVLMNKRLKVIKKLIDENSFHDFNFTE